MKLSIGIPSYNQGHFIAETILSLLSQTVAPFEIVVSENHSTDNTPQILQQFGDKIKVIKPDHHLTMMENWNFLVANLRGEWFSLFSSDDTAESMFVEEISKTIDKEGHSAVLIGTGFNFIDERSQLLEKHYLLSVNKKTAFPKSFLERLDNPKFSFAAFACKKDSWKKVGGFPEELKLWGDWGLWLKLSPLGNFIYIDKLLANYRSYIDERITKRRLNEIIDFVTIYRLVIRKIVLENRILLEKKHKGIIGYKLNEIKLSIPEGHEDLNSAIEEVFSLYKINSRKFLERHRKSLLSNRFKKVARSVVTLVKSR